MKNDYTKLDAAIIAQVAKGCVGFTELCNVVEGHSKVFAGGYTPSWRIVVRRLQALRKSGRICYQKKPEGWVLNIQEGESLSYAHTNAIACACVGIKPSALPVLNQPVKNDYTTKGLCQYNYAGREGLVINCYLEYEQAGRDTRDCPSQPESITLVYAFHKEEDISEVLSDDVVALIEEEALASMEMDKWNSDYDRGEERYNDREAA